MASNKRLLSIRKQLVATLIIINIIMFVIIFFIFRSILGTTFIELENRYAKSNVIRARNTIDVHLDELSSKVAEWAPWDDTYEFIEIKNQEYIDANINEESFATTNVNVMVFINSSGNITFAKQYDIENEKFTELDKDFINYISGSYLAKNRDPQYNINGLIMLPKGPMMIASYPILKSNYDGPMRGNMVMGRYLNNLEIEKLSEDLELSIRLETIDNMNPEVTDLITTSNPIAVVKLDRYTLSSHIILNDIHQNPILDLIIDMPRDIYAFGLTTLNHTVVAMIIVGLITTLAIIIVMEKNIISRLLELSREAKLVGNEGNLSLRLKPQKINDEIALVSDEINQMLEKIEETQNEIQNREEQHRSLLETKIKESTLELTNLNKCLLREIDTRKNVEAAIEYIAYNDELTGLPNRLSFFYRLQVAIDNAECKEKTIGVMYLDLDDFKMINDTVGHEQGDELLQEVGYRLSNQIRRGDIIARFGGDEFLILVQNISDVNALEIIADKIISVFNEPFILNHQDFNIKGSIGISVYPTDGEDVGTLIRNADIAMNKAKEVGKNKYAFCTSSMKNNVVETMQLTNKLYRAMDCQEFMIYYQPQVDSRTSKIIGVEALIHWKQTELGFIPPNLFIPIAEKIGLIHNIGEWVFYMACKQAKEWQDRGLPPISMAVNVSIEQFSNPNLVKNFENIINDIGIDAKYLELEITEGVVMKDASHIINTLNQFKKLGLSIAIDDFGTEYCSLSYIKQLPVDKIKIAMPFVRGINCNEKDEAVVKIIISLAQNLKLNLIAEGVETEDQMKFLQEHECYEIQGYYYHKPMLPEDIENILDKFGGTQ